MIAELIDKCGRLHKSTNKLVWRFWGCDIPESGYIFMERSEPPRWQLTDDTEALVEILPEILSYPYTTLLALGGARIYGLYAAVKIAGAPIMKHKVVNELHRLYQQWLHVPRRLNILLEVPYAVADEIVHSAQRLYKRYGIEVSFELPLQPNTLKDGWEYFRQATGCADRRWYDNERARLLASLDDILIGLYFARGGDGDVHQDARTYAHRYAQPAR